ncbi:MAG: EamA family transporter, partial [Alphaproteobacteria bacterium]
WYWALGRGGIARIGITQFAQPVVSLALAVAILGEAMTLPLAATAACIVAGIWIAQRRREPVRK